VRTLHKHLICLVIGLQGISCINLGKEAKISISNPSGINDLCVSINSSSKKEAKTLPYTYTASEGENVTIYAFTSNAAIANGSVTTRITNSCEDEINYSAKVFAGYMTFTDDYQAVRIAPKIQVLQINSKKDSESS